MLERDIVASGGGKRQSKVWERCLPRLDELIPVRQS